MADLETALSVVTDSQKKLLLDLYHNYGQEHLLSDDGFRQASVEDRQALANQLEALDNDYSNGGLKGYIENARKLLKDSKDGVNPLDGWEPSVPQGANVDFGTERYKELEDIGLQHLGSVGFVLVAGGLGERLGYSSIKVRKIGNLV